MSLSGQVVVVIGGTSGIGLSTAQQARALGARVVITGRNSGRLAKAAAEVDAENALTLDLGDPARLEQVFAELPGELDHVLVSGGGPFYAPIAELDFDRAERVLGEELVGPLRIARLCIGRVRSGGSLTLITGTGARRPGIGLSVAAIGTVGLQAIAANAPAPPRR